ncbi:MAG: DUF3817 domain-containing protein [Georgenia sp.]
MTSSVPDGVDAVAAQESKVRGAFARYRVMALVTGTMLLVLVLEMVLKYVLQLNGTEVPGQWTSARPVLGSWVAIVHGWIYVVYALTVFNLWSSMRWGLGRVAALIAGGVVPLLSFVMERRARRWVEADLPALLARRAARGA